MNYYAYGDINQGVCTTYWLTAGNGTYSFRMIWPGDDTSNSMESNIATVVPKATLTFTLTTNATTAHVGDHIRATATLSVQRSGTATVYWSAGSSGFIYSTTVTLTNGVCTAVIPVSATGTWRFKVNWPGDAVTNPAESNIVTVTAT